jgi:hypothetical protein
MLKYNLETLVTSIPACVVSIATGYGLDGQGLIPSKDEIFFLTQSRPALGLTQPSMKWVTGALSQCVKWLGCEADHSLTSRAKVKNGGAVPPLPDTSSWHGA